MSAKLADDTDGRPILPGDTYRLVGVYDGAGLWRVAAREAQCWLDRGAITVVNIRNGDRRYVPPTAMQYAKHRAV